MLPKQHRLRSMRDFKHLFKKGRRSGNIYLTVRTVKTKPGDPLRTAFIISNKTEKSAVKRNRAKRQLREIVRALLPQLSIGMDVAITIKIQFLPLSFKEKTEATVDVLKRANVLK